MASFSQPKASVLDKRRWQPRHDCRIHARITLNGHEGPCIITDISQGGAGIQFDNLMRPAVHGKTLLRCPAFGTLTATVRWVAGLKAGLEFTEHSRASAELLAFLDELSGAAGY